MSEPTSPANTPVIRVLIVDDHTIVRKGIGALLATEPDIQVVGEARDGREAISQAERLCPDVILMDLVMPLVDGLEATRRIATRQPEISILVLTSLTDMDSVLQTLKAGAAGYVFKGSGPEQLVRAIHEVCPHTTFAVDAAQLACTIEQRRRSFVRTLDPSFIR